MLSLVIQQCRFSFKEQDPAFFGNDSAAAAKKVLEIRYSLLPYLYTLFYHAHVDGGTVLRSLAHEYAWLTFNKVTQAVYLYFTYFINYSCDSRSQNIIILNFETPESTDFSDIYVKIYETQF